MDEKTPGWERKIELEFLDMGDSNCCVIGQVYDDYEYGEALDYLGLDSWGTSEDEARYGFDQDHVSRYSALKHLWLKEIAKRREEE